jgi:hypothetical protein
MTNLEMSEEFATGLLIITNGAHPSKPLAQNW